MSAAPRPHLSLHPGLEGSLLGSPNRGPSSIPGQSPGMGGEARAYSAVFLWERDIKAFAVKTFLAVQGNVFMFQPRILLY